MSHNRLFTKHTGMLLVKIRGIGEAEVFGKNWPVLSFILMAWKKITGEDVRTFYDRKEAKKWRLIRAYFYEKDGVIEAAREDQI